MIDLAKPVRRRTRGAYGVLWRHRPRQIIVSLVPGDLLEFREAGRRQVWTLPVDSAFKVAVTRAAFAAAAAKRAARAAKRRGVAL